LLPLAAVYWLSPSLAVAIPAAIAARLIAGVLLGVATFRALGITRWRMPDRAVMSELFAYGKWTLLFSGAGVLAGTLDRVLIGAILGARYVTYYSAPQNLVTRLNMLPSAMLRSLFPRLSAASREDAHNLARDALAFLNGVFTPCMIVALFAVKPFLEVWLGPGIAEAAAPVGRLLVMGVWLAGQSSILGILIQAQGNPASAARISWLQLPFYAAALWGATHVLGLIGAGAVVVAKSLCDYAIYIYFARVHPRGIVGNMLAHLAFIAVAFGLASLSLTLTQAAAGTFVIASANLGLSLHQSTELRKIVRRFVMRTSVAQG
jgi:O-antigen/teichoic acid export membrane protein